MKKLTHRLMAAGLTMNTTHKQTMPFKPCLWMVILLTQLMAFNSVNAADNANQSLETRLTNLFVKARQPLIDERARLQKLESQLCEVLPEVAFVSKRPDLNSELPKGSKLTVIATPEPFESTPAYFLAKRRAKDKYNFSTLRAPKNLPGSERVNALSRGGRGGNVSFEVELQPLFVVESGECKGTLKASGSRRYDIGGQMALPDGMLYQGPGRIALTTRGKHKITHTNEVFIKNSALGGKFGLCGRNYAFKPFALTVSELTNGKHEAIDVFGTDIVALRVALEDERVFQLNASGSTQIDLPLPRSDIFSAAGFNEQAEFIASLATGDGVKDMTVRPNVLASKALDDGKTDVRYGFTWFEDNKEKEFGVNVLLNPIPLTLSVVDQSAAENGDIFLPRNGSYVARISFESEQDFSKKTDTMTISRDGVYPINQVLETDLPDHVSSLYSGENALSFTKVDKQWQADFSFSLLKEKSDPPTVKRVLASGGSTLLHIDSKTGSIKARVISPLLTSLQISGQHGDGDDKETATQLDVFFGAAYSPAQDREVVIKVDASLDNDTVTETTSLSKDAALLALTESGDDVLRCTNGSCRPTGKAVGVVKLGLNLNLDAIPANVLLNGQKALSSETPLTVRVSQLQIIKGRVVEVFNEQELQQQRQALAGNLFEPEDIHIDQLERRRSLAETVSLIADGGVDMSRYSVQWQFADGSVGTSFTQGQDGRWVSQPSEQGDTLPALTKIMLLDASQNVVGEYRDQVAVNSQLGTAITLLTPKTAKLGEVVELKALIRNPQASWFTNHSQVFCRWSVGKSPTSEVLNAGVFRSEDTPVVFPNGGQLSCSNQLVFHRISDNVGVVPDVTVQLIDGGSR